MAPIKVLALIALLVVMKSAGNEARELTVELKTRRSDGAALCALDPVSVSAEMSARVPEAPGSVRCGMTCANDAECKHYNYKSTETNPCQLYYYKPNSFDVVPNCQHYHQPGQQIMFYGNKCSPEKQRVE